MTPEGKSEWSDVGKYHPPKGRDIMAVFHFYNGDILEQKIPNCPEGREHNVLFVALGSPWSAFDNGIIRQTKDIEKVVWSYC